MTDRQSDSVIPWAVLHVGEKKEMDGGIKKGGADLLYFPTNPFPAGGQDDKKGISCPNWNNGNHTGLIITRGCPTSKFSQCYHMDKTIRKFTVALFICASSPQNRTVRLAVLPHMCLFAVWMPSSFYSQWCDFCFWKAAYLFKWKYSLPRGIICIHLITLCLFIFDFLFYWI